MAPPTALGCGAEGFVVVRGIIDQLEFFGFGLALLILFGQDVAGQGKKEDKKITMTDVNGSRTFLPKLKTIVVREGQC